MARNIMDVWTKYYYISGSCVEGQSGVRYFRMGCAKG